MYDGKENVALYISMAFQEEPAVLYMRMRQIFETFDTDVDGMITPFISDINALQIYWIESN